MAQTVQIVPAYSFPHVATYINDYTVVADEDTSTSISPITTYLYAGPAGRGIANKYIKLTDYTVAKTIFGDSEFATYGQPLMTTLDLLNPDGIAGGATNVWFMRLMPENASYANIFVYIGYKIDDVYSVESDEDDSDDVEYVDVVDDEGDIIYTLSEDEDGNTVAVSEVTKTITRTVVVKNENTEVTYTYVETIVETYSKSTTIIMTTEATDADVLLYATGTEEYTDDGTETSATVTKGYVLTSSEYSYTVAEDDGDPSDVIEGEIPEIVTDSSNRMFRVKFTTKYFEAVTDQSYVSEMFNSETSPREDAEGYITYPVLWAVASGTGDYANDYSLRITQSISYDADYNMKVLCFSILNLAGTVSTDAQYMGSLVDTTRYSEIIQIEDILDAVSDGVAPVSIGINQDAIEAVYDAYKEYCLTRHDELEELYDEKFSDFVSDIVDALEEANKTTDEDTVYATLENLLSGYYIYNEKSYSAYTEAYEYLTNLQDLIDNTESDSFIELDQFDPFTGTRLGSTTSLPLFAITQYYTGDSYETLALDDQLAYTDDDTAVDFSSVTGVQLEGGSDGYFSNPEERQDGWTYEDELEWCYKCAFDGTTDARVLTSKRIYVDAFFDANYPTEVKHILAELAIARNDAPCFLDTGIVESYSKWNRKLLIDEFSAYDDTYIISKNLHHYYTRETSTNKKVRVTITHFLAQQFGYHIFNYGTHIPMVKSYCQLSGHVKDSLAPTIEDYEKTLKEALNQARFNYFEVVSDNVYQRATQNTSQTTTSDLLEESNIHVLFELKRILEADCDSYLYNFLEESVRTNFKKYEEAKFADWTGVKLQAFDIRFECNEYEYNHSILHCYVDITFRGLIKYVTIEIDVNKRVYSEDEDSEE